MADDNPLHQDDDLPEWLQGKMGDDEADSDPVPESDAPLDSADDASGGTSDLPWMEGGEESDTDQPAQPGQIRGLTAALPWLGDDAPGDGTSGDGEPATSGDDALPDMDWEFDDVGAEDAPRSEDDVRGLTGDLPWMDGDAEDESAPDAGHPPPEPDALDDMRGELLELDDEGPLEESAPAEPAAPEPQRRRGLLDSIRTGEAQPQEVQPPPEMAAPESQPEIEPDSTLPGWLDGDLGDLAEPEVETEAQVAAEDAPDWMSGDLADLVETGDEEAVETPAVREDSPDWLVAAEDLGPEFEAEAVVEEVDSQIAEPEWVADDTGELDEGLVSDVSYEEWQEQQEEAEREPEPEELLAQEVPGFFEELPDLAADEAVAEAPAEPTGADFVPDWYLGLEEQDTTEAPEWFGDIDFSADTLSAAPTLPPEPEPVPEPVPDAPGVEPALEIDDLLASLEEAAEDEMPDLEALAAAPDLEAGEVPDWFAEAGVVVDEAAPVPQDEMPGLDAPVAAPDLEAGEVPDWLAEAGVVVDETAAAPPEPVLPDASPPGAPPVEAEVPDWFASFDAPQVAPQVAPDSADEGEPEPLSPEQAAELSEAPDWLSHLPEDDLVAASMPVGTDELVDQGEDFDFMSLIEDQIVDVPEMAVPVEGADLLTEQYADFDLDDLLADQAVPGFDELPAPEAAAVDEASGMPIDAEGEVPDWLQQARPDTRPGGAGPSAVDIALRVPETPEEELTTRLQGLRALTSQVAEAPEVPLEDESNVALAGVTDGLVPTEAFRALGAPEMVMDITPDEAQQARVGMLEHLLGLDIVPPDFEQEIEYDDDGEPIMTAVEVDEAQEAARLVQADRRARARSRFKPDRIVVSLLVLLALLLPFFVEAVRIVQLPETALEADSPQGAVFAKIDRLTPRDIVLVGFEYGPTAAGEMDALAETLLTHILLNDARPVVVSTSPAGTLQARNLLNRLANDPYVLAQLGRAPNDPLLMPDDYVVLPYLPGGGVGLRALSTLIVDENVLPLSIFAVDLEGRSTGLTADRVRSSLELILVLAERGEDVRLWMEQVGAVVGVDMAAAVTVAAEPIARPYLRLDFADEDDDSNRLIGLLAGYRDAYAYDGEMLAALPEVTARPLLDSTTEESDIPAEATPVAELTTMPGTPGADGLPTATIAEGMVVLTSTPTPSDTPTVTSTATDTPTETATASNTPTNREATRTAVAIASGTILPTATPSDTPIATSAFATFTPMPEDGAGGQEVASGPQNVEPNRPYRDERWYSMGLGVLMVTGIIVLGTGVNVARAIRRRRNQ